MFPACLLRVPLDVICHQKLNFLFAPVQSFHPVCHHSNKKKTSLITEARNKEIPQLCMALEVTFFFPSFLSLNLCMSLWFHCSHTAVQRQSYTKRWNEKAVWGDIESQVNSTAGASAELQMFSPPLNSSFSSVSRRWGKWRRGDGESESRYGAVTSGGCGTGGRATPCDLTLIWRGDGGVRRLTAVQLIAPVFTRVQLELRCNSLRLVSRAGISSLQSSKCICAGLMKRPRVSDVFCPADRGSLKWI